MFNKIYFKMIDNVNICKTLLAKMFKVWIGFGLSDIVKLLSCVLKCGNWAKDQSPNNKKNWFQSTKDNNDRRQVVMTCVIYPLNTLAP